jgi:hypothetical protein
VAVTVDFNPTLDGAPHDPADNGGNVSRLVLWSVPERSGSVMADVSPAVKVSFGVYRFTLPEGMPPGRYWSTVTWQPDGDTEPIIDQIGHLDLPIRPDLLVSAEDVAVAVGESLPLSAEKRENLWAAILDAQQAVEGAIGPIFPSVFTQAGLWPYGTNLTDPATWFLEPEQIVVHDTVAATDGTYTVTYERGLNGAAEGPILRYIKAHAAAYYAAGPAGYSLPRLPTSVSAEGQSITWSGTGTARTTTGASPTLEDLKVRYVSRKPKVFQRRGAPISRPGPTQAGAIYYVDGPWYDEAGNWVP